jgi:hypothetical protein
VKPAKIFDSTEERERDELPRLLVVPCAHWNAHHHCWTVSIISWFQLVWLVVSMCLNTKIVVYFSIDDDPLPFRCVRWWSKWLCMFNVDIMKWCVTKFVSIDACCRLRMRMLLVESTRVSCNPSSWVGHNYSLCMLTNRTRFYQFNIWFCARSSAFLILNYYYF